MAKKSDTSITDNKAREFIKQAAPRTNLFCEKITGLHLFKTKTGGSWRYRYYDDEGKLRTVTIGRFTELNPAQAAEKALTWRNNDVDVMREREEQKQERLKAERESRARTLGDYLEGIYTQHQRRKKSGNETLNMIRSNFADWLNRDMATLSRADVREWQAGREEAGRAHATIKRAYGALKTMLNHAVAEEVLAQNPLDKVSLAAETDDEKQARLKSTRSAARRLLTDSEVAGFQKGLQAYAEEIREQRRSSRAHGKSHLPDLDNVAYPHWFIPFATAAYFTGMRPGDLYSLDWQELNLTFKRLHKLPEKTRHHPDPAVVMMDLPDQLINQLQPWWEQQGKPDAGLVFPSPRTGGKMDKKAHLTHWEQVVKLGDLPAELTFYSLRHNFISRLVANGTPLLTVAKLAGHKGTAMIEQHYGHLCPRSAATALDALAGSWGTVQEQEAIND